LENTEENCEKIWKIWQKRKLKMEIEPMRWHNPVSTAAAATPYYKVTICFSILIKLNYIFFFFIKITRQHELKTIVATQQFYCSPHRWRTRSINPPFVLPCDFDKKKKYIISDGNYSATVAIKVKIISTLLRQLAMILATKMFASDSQRWHAIWYFLFNGPIRHDIFLINCREIM
jgi:hypothetical protein